MVKFEPDKNGEGEEVTGREADMQEEKSTWKRIRMQASEYAVKLLGGREPLVHSDENR